jgi:hypothetical protein
MKDILTDKKKNSCCAGRCDDVFDEYLRKDANLSDLSDLEQARENLEVYGRDEVYNKEESDGRFVKQDASTPIVSRLDSESKGLAQKMTVEDIPASLKDGDSMLNVNMLQHLVDSGEMSETVFDDGLKVSVEDGVRHVALAMGTTVFPTLHSVIRLNAGVELSGTGGTKYLLDKTKDYIYKGTIGLSGALTEGVILTSSFVSGMEYEVKIEIGEKQNYAQREPFMEFWAATKDENGKLRTDLKDDVYVDRIAENRVTDTVYFGSPVYIVFSDKPLNLAQPFIPNAVVTGRKVVSSVALTSNYVFRNADSENTKQDYEYVYYMYDSAFGDARKIKSFSWGSVDNDMLSTAIETVADTGDIQLNINDRVYNYHYAVNRVKDAFSYPIIRFEWGEEVDIDSLASFDGLTTVKIVTATDEYVSTIEGKTAVITGLKATNPHKLTIQVGDHPAVEYDGSTDVSVAVAGSDLNVDPPDVGHLLIENYGVDYDAGEFESFGGTVRLNRVAKTGDYEHLTNKPRIHTGPNLPTEDMKEGDFYVQTEE